MKLTNGLIAGVVFLLLILGLSCRANNFRDLSPPGLSDAPGIWINLWHYPDGDLDVYCSRLQSYGIGNVFVQTSRSNTEAIRSPEKLGALLEACHRHNLRVIAWSFAELIDPKSDAAKLIGAARFESPQGELVDGVAGNLEKNLNDWRVELYSTQVRQALGPNYPMTAVVFSPLNRAPEVARTPWKLLAQHWDVIAPMSYWAGRYQNLDPYTYTVSTIQAVRQLIGRSDIEIHAIGDGMGTDPGAIQKFLKACKDAEATSASLYPNHRPTVEQLSQMARYSDYFQTNSRFRLAAYQELTKSGLLAEPPKHDPAQMVAKGEFYRLVVQLLYAHTQEALVTINSLPHASALSQTKAWQILASAGLIEAVPESVQLEAMLSSPIDSKDALILVARLLELKSSGARSLPQASIAKARGDRWLVQAAFAEAKQVSAYASNPVNYMDAAQILLAARGGLR
ncbi:MAG: hypothetical protein HY711_01400 [Candidatus Melainabacteria bacterium]|nr:hypothetical protein [Candidatus Melainabacteria bacterium]